MVIIIASVLVSGGYHVKIPETEWLEQQTFSHSSEGRKSEIKVPAWLGSGESLFPGL